MAKQQRFCKYCGSRLLRTSVCGNCSAKLKLIRKIRAMVLAEKKRVDSIQGGDTVCTTSSKLNNE